LINSIFVGLKHDWQRGVGRNRSRLGRWSTRAQ
jgi:hypothetical protein